MADLISRQEAIDIFGKLSQGKYYTSLINALPSAQPEQRWIPCSERLPEKYGAYIVTDIYGDVEIASFQEHWRHDEEIQAWWLEEYGFIEALAWMPLPEPWKGEADVGDK